LTRTTCRGVPPLAPMRRKSMARTLKPAAWKAAAKRSVPGSLVTPVPPAMTTQAPLVPG
jgi:hypothetical protein